MPRPSLFLNDFTVLDFAFFSSERGLLGESFFVSAELFGSLDHKDFLLDFSLAKKTLKALVDECLDHKLLLPEDASSLRSKNSVIEWLAEDGSEWTYRCPSSAFLALPGKEISSQSIEKWLSAKALASLPKNVSEVRFSLRSPQRFQGEASFRYTHGLRFHEGNCQRLMHGHRNPIEVWLGDLRSPIWEARLAAEWDGAHFVALPTLKNRGELDLVLGERRWQASGSAIVAYEGSQGSFSASIPASRVILTEREPSIETMSALALKRLRSWGLQGRVRVLAYEGLNKGASMDAAEGLFAEENF